jgi:hypothetical protein
MSFFPDIFVKGSIFSVSKLVHILPVYNEDAALKNRVGAWFSFNYAGFEP